MKFYGDDFFSAEDVSSWKDSTQLLYLKILWRQWAHLGLAEDPRVISANIGTPWHKFKTAWATFGHKFPLDSDNRRRNQKLHAIFLGEEKAFEGRKKGADTVNAKRKAADAERTLSDTDSARQACGNGELDVELELPPPPPRLLGLLRLWDAQRSPMQKAAPPVSPSLVKAFTAADVPGRDWDAICLYLCTTPDANGTGTPGRGYKVGFAASFAWMLSPKGIEAAEQQTFGAVDIDPIKFQAAKAMAELERRQRERNGNQIEGDKP